MRYFLIVPVLMSCASFPKIPDEAIHYQRKCMDSKDTEACRVCTEFTSELPECWNGLGLYEMRDGHDDYQAAACYFQLAIEADRNYVQGYNNLAIAHFRMGNTKLAINLLNEVLTIDPGFKEARENLMFIQINE